MRESIGKAFGVKQCLSGKYEESDERRNRILRNQIP